MVELKSSAMDALESMAGRKITYAGISPSFFRYLEVRDLTIHDAQDPGKSLLTIHNVRVYYSIARLLISRDPVESIREIRLLNTNFSLDLDRDKDVADLFLRLAGTGSGSLRLQARITGANIGVSIVSRGLSLKIDGMYFQIEARPETLAVSVRGKCQARLPSGFTFASPLKAQGTLDRSLTASDVTVRLLSFTSSLVSAGAQTLQLVWKGDTINVRKIQDRSPVELDLMVDFKKQEGTLNFQTADMRLDRLISFSKKLDKYAHWLTIPLTASGHVTYRLPDQSLEYQADASAFFEDQLPLHQVSIAASFEGTEKEVFFQPLRLSSENGSIEFEGSIPFDTFYPAGLLTLADIKSGSGEKVSAQLVIERLQGGLDAQGSHFAIGEVAFNSFHLTLSPMQNGASFSVSASFAGAQQDDLLQANGELNFGQPLAQAVSEGKVSSLPNPLITVSATLKNAPPDRLYHLILGAGSLSGEQRDLYDLLGRFSVSADVALSTDLSSISIASKGVTITDVHDPGTSLRFGLSTDASHVSLTGFAGTWKGFTVQGGFEGDLGAAGQVAFTSDFTFLGTPYSFAGRYSPSQGLFASGSYGLVLSATPITAGGIAVRVAGDMFPLRLPDRTLTVSFDASGLITQEGEWSADVSSLTLHDIPFLESTKNTIQLAGRLTPQRLELSRISFADAFSTLIGSASMDISLPTDILDPQLVRMVSVQGNAAVKTADGKESYVVRGGLQKGMLSLAVQFAGSPIARLGKSAIQGSISGAGSITGPMEKPGMDLSLALKDGKLGTDPLSIGGQITLLPEETLRVQSLAIGYLSHRLTGGAGQIDLKNGTYAFNAHYQGEYFADQVNMAVGIEGRYSSPADASHSPGLMDMRQQGKVSLSGITVAATAFPSWSVAYNADSGKLSLDGGPGNSLHGWIDSQLAFSLTIADPLPLIGAASGRIVGDRIHATADIETLDLLVLNSMLKSPSVNTSAGPLPVFHVTSGVATGRLVIDGAINDPDFTGQLDVVGGGVSSAYSPDEAGPIRTTLVFDGKAFHAQNAIVAAGSSRLNAQGDCTIDHWSPLAWDITLATEGKTPAHLRVRFGRLIADGSASGQVRIAGDDRKTTVTGSLAVGDCRIALGEYPQGKFEPEEPPTYVSLGLETAKRVEFSWPSLDVPVLRATASPGGKVAVTYRGDTGAYTVKGTTGVQGGEIYYFDRSFIIKKGSIAFNEDQNTFDPWITARAEVREWDPATGEEVKIYLDADSPFSKFSPRFSSDPSRTESALLAMIGAPLANRAESQGLGVAAFVYSDILAQNLILRPFEEKVRQLLDLDMFSIHTQILQNLVAQKLFSYTVNPLDNTSVSLGKYIGNDLFLEMLVSLQQQQIVTGTNNTLVIGGTGLQPDLELSLEWATPFFLMEWSFLPQHPEDLFLSDNSLAFSWRFSY
jgi:hypothetical protein